ncbi:hypothetical protein D3C79_1028630 [compost metagenome]
MFSAQQQPAFLGRYQAIFHHMGHADPGVDAHDACSTLQRVRSTHAGFQLSGLGRVALQRHQPCDEHLGLSFGFQAEQLEQRCVAHLLWGHDRLRCTADSKC